MDKALLLKLMGVFFIILIVSALVLFVLQLVSVLFFWTVMILGALVAYVGIPKLKGR